MKFAAQGIAMTQTELLVLLFGCVTAFLVSLVVIRGLMDYVKKHTFSAFGIYRIALGAVVILYFLLSK